MDTKKLIAATEAAELKPCPFCDAANDVHVVESPDDKFGVECLKCEGSIGVDRDRGHLFKTRGEAIAAWNTRTEPKLIADLAAENAKLESAIRLGANMPDEENEWDAVEKYSQIRAALAKVLGA